MVFVGGDVRLANEFVVTFEFTAMALALFLGLDALREAVAEPVDILHVEAAELCMEAALVHIAADGQVLEVAKAAPDVAFALDINKEAVAREGRLGALEALAGCLDDRIAVGPLLEAVDPASLALLQNPFSLGDAEILSLLDLSWRLTEGDVIDLLQVLNLLLEPAQANRFNDVFLLLELLLVLESLVGNAFAAVTIELGLADLDLDGLVHALRFLVLPSDHLHELVELSPVEEELTRLVVHPVLEEQVQHEERRELAGDLDCLLGWAREEAWRQLLCFFSLFVAILLGSLGELLKSELSVPFLREVGVEEGLEFFLVNWNILILIILGRVYKHDQAMEDNHIDELQQHEQLFILVHLVVPLLHLRFLRGGQRVVVT
uniref:Uncharacterized protein n=1 Tax=Strombidium inclinatum TaxID=197538 RepID=A0A7S3MTP1_9SPIT|mmetsp:Transcript_12185/g.18823  ORF Transcript_12185/g.18823 Transcript_12185/m.18823 type:complete len:377 (+) Transcript_12185:770-1900(+)